MSVVELIQSYGYLAVAVGTFLEGETMPTFVLCKSRTVNGGKD